MYFSYDHIEQQASNFLQKYHPKSTIPVPIEHIVEVLLELSIVPVKSLLHHESIDAFLSHDLSTLFIDEDHYMGQTTRSRFTLAHEAGHIVLHKNFIEQNVKTIEQWKEKILGAGTGRAVYETQANQFAGCVLMPKPNLIDAYKKIEQNAQAIFKASGIAFPDAKNLIPYISNDIARLFEVSPQSAEIRLKNVLATECVF